MRKVYEDRVKKGKLKQDKAEARVALLKPTLSYDDLHDADLVIEAVFEDIGVKEAVFRKLDEVCKPGAILASNTSTLDLNRIAAFTKRPQDVIGLHFFSPANVMKLLEVVRGAQTGTDVLATAMQLAKKIRKTAVVSGVCDGFIGNRMVAVYQREAFYLLEEGASVQQIDKALENFGMAMGLFRMGDLAGGDIGWAIRKRKYAEKPQMRRFAIADKLCEMGRFGQKTGAGFYRYEPGRRDALRDPVVDEIVDACRKEAGITPRKITDEEIVAALHLRAGQRGRADPRGGHRAARLRHRHGLRHRLRLPAVPRRPDALRRHGRPDQRRARDAALRAAAARRPAFWQPAPLLARRSRPKARRSTDHAATA